MKLGSGGRIWQESEERKEFDQNILYGILKNKQKHKKNKKSEI